MTCKMSYTKKIQWRIRLLWLAVFGMLIFMVVIGELGLHSSKVVTGFAYTWGSVLYWIGLFYAIGRIIINKKLLKDRLLLKEQQLRERDERNQYLHRMSGGWVMDAMLVLCYLATVVAFYDFDIVAVTQYTGSFLHQLNQHIDAERHIGRTEDGNFQSSGSDLSNLLGSVTGSSQNQRCLS